MITLAQSRAENFHYKSFLSSRSCCGSVGRAVASDTRGPWFESSHRQKFINTEYLYTVNCVLKRRKINKKRPGIAHLKKSFLSTLLEVRPLLFTFSPILNTMTIIVQHLTINRKWCTWDSNS